MSNVDYASIATSFFTDRMKNNKISVCHLTHEEIIRNVEQMLEYNFYSITQIIPECYKFQ